ncbi:hypothetical protein ACFLZ1_05195, partial [Patescibacteria group bacterium]
MVISENGEKKSGKIFGKLPDFRGKFKKIIKKPSFSWKFPKGKTTVIAVLVIIFLALFVSAGFAFYWYVPKAKVSIFLQPKVLEKELEIIVDPEVKDLDVENGVIPGKFVDLEIEGSKTKEATGEKLVGDKAEGEVTVYNKTDLSKAFSSGTVLIGPDKLAFVLDEDITIASKSAEASDEGEQVVYGKTVTNITASSIGTESNLSADTQLTFSKYPASLYSAKVKDGLSGGTSRQIKAVSAEDQEKLLEELTEEIKGKVEAEIKAKISSDEELLDKEVEMEIVSKEFSHDEGDEADSLSLDLKVKYTFLVYKKQDLTNLLMHKISDIVPENFVFSDQTTDFDASSVKFEDKKANIQAIVKAKLVPQLDKEEVKKNLKGKYPEVVQDYLKSIPNFSKADIEISPRLPNKLHTLPRVIDNIEIEIKIEE